MSDSQEDSIMVLLRPTISDPGDLLDITRKLQLHKITITSLLLLKDEELDDLIRQVFQEKSIGTKMGLKMAIRLRKENSTQGKLKLVHWLNQRLDRLDFKYGNLPIVSRYARNWPKNFHRWNNIGNEADDYFAKFERDTQGYTRIWSRNFFVTDKDASSSLAMACLLKAFDKGLPIAPGFDVIPEDTALITGSHSQGGTSIFSEADKQATLLATNKSATRGYIDLGCVTDTGAIFYIIEMKRTSLFRDRETDELLDLLDVLVRFAEQSLRPEMKKLSARERYMAHSIGQLFTYMVAKSVGYGALSTSDVTYFIRRLVDNTIQVSQGFQWEDGNFLKTLAYTLHLGFEDTELYNTESVKDKGFSSKPPKSSRKAASDPTSGSPRKKSKSHVDSESSSLQGSVTTAGSVDSSDLSMDYILRETRAEDLNMEDEPFACGWSGNIVKGMYNGVPIAIKLALRNSVRAEALVNEAHTYLKLQGLWGVHVPHLVVWGTTAQGRVVFIATEFISGFELQPGSASLHVRRAAILALEAVHNCGILHGDIRASNIMVLSDGVRLLDFGFSRSLRRGWDFDATVDEVRQLVKLLGWSTAGLSQDIPTGALPWTPSGITC